jgi:histidine triad (HIT) family protein
VAREDPAAACLFCRIAAKRIPSEFVHEDADVVAFKDIRPVAPFHVLVIPKRHVRSLTDADAALAGKLATVAAKLAGDAGYAQSGFRVVTNVGPDAGQSVEHIHFHVLAGRGLGWPPG